LCAGFRFGSCAIFKSFLNCAVQVFIGTDSFALDDLICELTSLQQQAVGKNQNLQAENMAKARVEALAELVHASDSRLIR
jgi:hypothetical protein